MKRTVIENNAEKNILTAMVISKEFLGGCVGALHLDWTDNQIIKQVAEWCLAYYKNYNRAPRRNLEALYRRWADNEKTPKEDAEAVADFLEHLSDIFDKKRKVNVPFLKDELRRLIQKRKLDKHIDNLKFQVAEGQFQTAEEAAAAYQQTEIGHEENVVDLLADDKAWETAFEKSTEPLFTFPYKDVNTFFGHALARDSLIGIQGPEKRGKTWFCLEIAAQALRQRCKVAFFEVGDMSKSQIMKRFGVRFTGLPQFKKDLGVINVPKKFIKEDFPDAKNNREEEDDEEDGHGYKDKKEVVPGMICHKKELKEIVSARSCIEACKQKIRRYILPEGVSFIKLCVRSNRSINVKQIHGILDGWKIKQGFVPDVIIIDYADILAPEDPRMDVRAQTNETWQALRRLSQDWHCLVVTPTQATRESYSAKNQSMKHASEDKRKLAHVTGMIGLNQNAAEKSEKAMRLNWVVLREADFNENRCLWIGQCLTIGRFICCGKF